MTSAIVCVDASFIVRMFISNTPDTFENLWNQWGNAGYDIVAPTLIYYEISNSFHRSVIAGQLLQQEAIQLLHDALNLNIILYGDAELHRQALNIATQLKLPATYDAHYLALAQQLGCEFWTADKRLFNAVQPTLSWVNLVQ